jgi:uncharacterized membrane protein
METKKLRQDNPFNYYKNNFNAIGRLPSPEILLKYNSVIPGLADRIVAQAEKQTFHRIALEKKLLTSNIWKSFLGLVFGFLISSLGIGGGLYLTFVGFNVIGIIFSSATLVSLVMTFIYGSQYRKNQSSTNRNACNSIGI